VRETDACALCPVEQCTDERTGLRDERDTAGACTEVGEARIQSDAGDNQSDAVRPEDAQCMAPRALQHRGRERAAARGRRLEARAQHHRRARAARAELRDQTRNAHRGCADDGEIRSRRQLPRRRIGAHAPHRRVPHVDRPHRAAKSAAHEVAHDRRADAAGAIGGANHRKRLRSEEIFEMVTAHGACWIQLALTPS